MSPFSSTIIHKNQFDIAEKNRVIVLTKQEGDAGKCIEAGAKLAGGDKVLRKVISKAHPKPTGLCIIRSNCKNYSQTLI